MFSKFSVCLGRKECNAETNPQTDPRGAEKTPGPLPRVAGPIIERERRHLHGNQPSGVSTERWEDDEGGMRCNSWSLTRLSASLLTLMTQKTVHSLPLRVLKNMESLLWLRALCCFWRKALNSLHLTGDIWNVNTTRAGSKQRLNDVVLWYYPLIGYSPILCFEPRQLLTVLWMISPAVWRSVGCGRRTASLRRGARTGAGVAAAVELRMGSKKSFLLSRRQIVWSMFKWMHLPTHGLSLLYWDTTVWCLSFKPVRKHCA